MDVLDRGRNLQSAIAAPRIHVPDSGTVLVEPRSRVELTLDLAKRGYRIGMSEYGARVAAVSRDLHEPGYVACVDPRSDQGAAVVDTSEKTNGEEVD